ncbi:MAG: efflux transporter periplasmic adaptor subunit [Alphaproteobacteria bacterium PA4]|nr:MAG: efflux transporter periplasmic adaptor subunit [Alphaproteobacteria bacterium PA4]
MNASSSSAEFFGAASQPLWQRHRRWLIGGAVLVPLLLVLARCTGGENAVQYVTVLARRGDIMVTVTATGNLAPTNQVDVSSEISGIVNKVLVEVNDRVVAGQPIAIIDTVRLNDAVTRSRATLAANNAAVVRERAVLLDAQLQLQRLRDVLKLSGGQVPSQTELQAQVAAVARAQAALATAQANVTSARAQLSSDSTNMDRAIIRSPVSGVVLKRSIDPGQTVQVAFNTPSLFIIAEDLKRMQLEVSVDEADVGQVKAGQRASFTVDAWPGRSFPARIDRVDLGARNLSTTSTASTTAGVVSYVATLSLDNADLSLRPGMTATATIPTAGSRNVLLVPNAALRFKPPAATTDDRKRGFQFRPPNPGQGTTVVRQRGIGVGSTQPLHVLDKAGRLRAVAVVTGQTDGRFTAVSGADIRPGMPIVTGVKAGPAS